MYDLISLQEILHNAKEKNATDLHFSAGAHPAIRVGGKLSYLPYPCVLPEDIERILTNILNEEQKKRLETNRYLNLSVAFKDIGRLRANIFMQRGSFSINFKLLDKFLKTEEELNIPPVVMDLYQKESGLILICGYTNNGISTTMAAIVKKISETRTCHIITIENPIKYLFKHDKAIVNQKEIGIDANNFLEGVYSALTQDPDVIMISSCREPETIAAALMAAENGHLVITALRTMGAVNTLRYIIEMFPLEKRDHLKMQLANVLQAVVSQQLIPTKDGLNNIPAMEIMLATSAIKNLIVENKIYQIPAVIKASKSLGMITMEDYINDLYERGLISRESVLGFTE
jgi:twitching motility protein PilT